MVTIDELIKDFGIQLTPEELEKIKLLILEERARLLKSKQKAI